MSEERIGEEKWWMGWVEGGGEEKWWMGWVEGGGEENGGWVGWKEEERKNGWVGWKEEERKMVDGWVGGGGEEIITITFRKYCYIHNYSLNLHSVNFSSLVHVQLIS